MPLAAPSPSPEPAEAGAATAGDDFRAAVLKTVDLHFWHGGKFTTADIASIVGRQPGRDSNRKHSAHVLEQLCALEAIGHVRRSEDGPPVVWIKT